MQGHDLPYIITYAIYIGLGYASVHDESCRTVVSVIKFYGGASVYDTNTVSARRRLKNENMYRIMLQEVGS